MNRIVSAAFAACVAVASLGLAPTASADGAATPRSPAPPPPPVVPAADTLGRCPCPTVAPPDICCPRPLRFEVALPIWIPGVTGEYAIGDVEVKPTGGSDAGHVATSRLFDVLADFEFAFVGRIEAKFDPWAVRVDGFGVKFGTAIAFRGDADETGDTSAWIFHADVSRRIASWCLGTTCDGFERRFEMRAYAGVRYTTVTAEISFPGDAAADLHRSADWFDPLVGLRASYDLSSRFSLEGAADVGGFGVGSDLAVWVSGALRYRISRTVSVAAGWNALSMDYETGKGSKRFEFGLDLSGPSLEIAFSL